MGVSLQPKLLGDLGPHKFCRPPRYPLDLLLGSGERGREGQRKQVHRVILPTICLTPEVQVLASEFQGLWGHPGNTYGKEACPLSVASA